MFKSGSAFFRLIIIVLAIIAFFSSLYIKDNIQSCDKTIYSEKKITNYPIERVHETEPNQELEVTYRQMDYRNKKDSSLKISSSLISRKIGFNFNKTSGSIRYSFRPTKDGVHMFSVDVFNKSDDKLIEIQDSNGKSIGTLYDENYNVLKATLNKNNLYYIVIKNPAFFEIYNIKIFLYRESFNITNYPIVKDNIDYEGQVIEYKFRADSRGYYAIRMDGGIDVRFAIKGPKDKDFLLHENIMHNKFGNDVFKDEDSIYFFAYEKGEYRIRVIYKENTGKFKMRLFKPDPYFEIQDNSIVLNNLDYTYEQHIYHFKPTQSLQYLMQFDKEGKVAVSLMDSKNDYISLTFNGDTFYTSKPLEKNKDYFFVVTNFGNKWNYQFNIKSLDSQ